MYIYSCFLPCQLKLLKTNDIKWGIVCLYFLFMPLCKAVSVHNKTQRHITGLALPGSEISFFVHLVAVLASPAAL